MLKLDTSVQYIPRVGPVMAKKLAKLDILTVEDLLWHFPFRYDNFQITSPISSVQAGETVTVKGTVLSSNNLFTKNGKKITTVKLGDDSGMIEAIWFNQFYLKNVFAPDSTWQISGKADWFGHKVVFVAPEYERVSTPVILSEADSGVALRSPQNDALPFNNIHTGRLVPVYPETAGVSSKWLRGKMAYLLQNGFNKLSEYLPQEILQRNNFLTISSAISQIHFPDSTYDVENAKRRLAFEELFFLQLAAQMRKYRWQLEKNSVPFVINQEKVLQFVASLPFTLTSSQDKALKEVLSDLQKKVCANRLLEGDVGSGKTVVAAIAMYVTFLNGYQVAFMAPTEILAQQHYQTVTTLLAPFGVKVKLLTGSITNNQQVAINNQPFDVLIGTHSLLYKKAKFKNLAFVVIDEQHRFGVEQRAILWSKGNNPHLLTMTATPIPRTVALAVYADMDLSILDEMPQGRQKIKTWVVPDEKREAANSWLKKHLQENHSQAFIICPLIEESDSLTSVKAVKKEFERIKTIFKECKVGLLHGRLKSSEKSAVLSDFRSGKIDILVATPVVEVGIDIPNATVMFIEGAERFGLAQLHQLRGRVGRGQKQSFCFLFSEKSDEKVFLRLKFMEKYFVGSKLAEEDLKLRGPGELFGVKQHGFGNLKIASFSDFKLMSISKTEAINLVETDPYLSLNPSLQEKVQRFLNLETQGQIT